MEASTAKVIFSELTVWHDWCVYPMIDMKIKNAPKITVLTPGRDTSGA